MYIALLKALLKTKPFTRIYRQSIGINRNTVILEIFALPIVVHLIFVVIYYLRFQEAEKKETSLQLNFRVFNFHGFLQPQIINNRKNFQNYGDAPLLHTKN